MASFLQDYLLLICLTPRGIFSLASRLLLSLILSKADQVKDENGNYRGQVPDYGRCVCQVPPCYHVRHSVDVKGITTKAQLVEESEYVC